MTERKWLFVCAAFASGEALASLGPSFAEAWPACAIAAILLAAWSLALKSRFLLFLCILAAGTGMYLFSAVENERVFRDKPWMRQIFARRTNSASASRPHASRIRRELSRRMGIGLGHSPATADMNRAILLGERFRLRADARRDFAASGTVHVFAISGLHVMVVASVFRLLSALAFVPYRFHALVALPALWGYVWMLGFPPSAVRAALMASVHFAAPLFWRRGNAVVSWSVAFMAMHITSPRLIADVGCQLSFVVMLAIVLSARQVRDMPELRQRLAVAFCAWAAGVPIVAHAFGTLAPGGLVANLALVPAAMLAVVACTVGVVLSWVAESLCAYANNFAALVTSVMSGLSSLVARVPGANFEVGPWGAAECALWYSVLFAIPLVLRLMAAKRLF